MSVPAIATITWADALARVPAEALPAPLAVCWRTHAEAGAPMRDRPEVLADTLARIISREAAHQA